MEALALAVGVEAVVAVVETEEGAEARVGVAPASELEDPEVLQGCGCAMKHTYLPCPKGQGKLAHYYVRDGPPHGPGLSYLQELAHVQTVLRVL